MTYLVPSQKEMVRSFWDLEVLREKGDGRPSERSSMWQSQREELEAWERDQAEKLREST